MNARDNELLSARNVLGGPNTRFFAPPSIVNKPPLAPKKPREMTIIQIRACSLSRVPIITAVSTVMNRIFMFRSQSSNASAGRIAATVVIDTHIAMQMIRIVMGSRGIALRSRESAQATIVTPPIKYANGKLYVNSQVRRWGFIYDTQDHRRIPTCGLRNMTGINGNTKERRKILRIALPLLVALCPKH